MCRQSVTVCLIKSPSPATRELSVLTDRLTALPDPLDSQRTTYSTNHQVVIDADARLVVVVGEALPGNRNDCRAREESGAKAAVGRTLTMADGGYTGTGLLMPHRRTPGEELPGWKREHNRSHKQVRPASRTSSPASRRKILRDCRLKGDGVRHAMLGIARLHNLALTG